MLIMAVNKQKQPWLTQRLQERRCSCIREDEQKVALGIHIEVWVTRHVCMQHKLPHSVRFAMKQDVQAPAANS